MKKKGFTLIELLAVIILAIIALIATPIIMRVIERSKKGAAERSAENYVSAVETEAMSLRTEGTILDGTYGINSNGNLCPNNASTCSESEEIKIEMSGKKPSSGSVVISNGRVTSTGTTLTIEDYTVTINESGSATATKGSGSSTSPTRYYSWGLSGSISGSLSHEYNPDFSNIDSNLSNVDTRGYSFYQAFDSSDGETIDAAYLCFVRNNTPYCLQGGVDSEEVFASNQDILDEAFKDSEFPCSEFDGYSCDDDGLSINIDSTGYVYIHGAGYYEQCLVNADGSFECSD